MLQAAETSFGSTESSRRRSTFYVPLTGDTSCHESPSDDPPASSTPGTKPDEYTKRSLERIYNPDLSACSFEWSLDDSLNSTNSNMLVSSERENKLKRYGIVLNASVNIDDDETTCHQKQSNTSTPIRLMKSRSRNNILNFPEKPSLLPSPSKEKSKTLPQNLSPANTFPPKSSFLLKSTPKISLNYSSEAGGGGANSSTHSVDPSCSPHSALSPKKSLSFIRRTHSTKLSRSNSFLKSLTSKCVDQNDNLGLLKIEVKELDFARLEKFIRAGDKADEMVRDMFLRCKDDKEEESAVHSGKYPNAYGQSFNLDF